MAEHALDTTPTRRALLGRMAAAAPLAAVAAGTAAAAPACPGPHPDAALLALGLELDAAWAAERRLDARFQATAEGSPEEAALGRALDAATDASSAVVGRIVVAPARTLDGVLVKVRAVAWCRCGDTLDPGHGATTDERLVWSVTRDLDAIGRA